MKFSMTTARWRGLLIESAKQSGYTRLLADITDALKNGQPATFIAKCLREGHLEDRIIQMAIEEATTNLL